MRPTFILPTRETASIQILISYNIHDIQIMSSQQNRGTELLGVQITFLVAAWVATLLRAYVKVAITKSHTLDDGVMYLSSVSLSPQVVSE